MALMFSVDMAIGPFLTLIVCTPSKNIKAIFFDFIVIAIIQLSALIYGIYTVYNQHPKLLILFEQSPGFISPLRTVNKLDNFKALMKKTEFSIEGVTTILNAKAEYVDPISRADILAKANNFFRIQAEKDGFNNELRNAEKNNKSTWLFYIEGKCKGAYILLNKNFEYINKFGEKKI